MAYVDEVLADVPLGYWRLNEPVGATTVVDSSGNGRNLTTTGTPTFQQASLLANDANTAATFSGGSLASTPAAAWMIVPNFTVEAWFKTSSTASQTIASMDDSGGAPGETRRRWSVVTSGGTVGFHIFAGGTVFYLQAAANCADGNPHHVVAVCENSLMRIYVDGILAGRLAYSGSLTGGVSAQNPFTIGSGYNQCPTTYWQFNGTIDEVAYYSSALGATRIAAHYTASGRTIPAINNSSSYAQVVMADAPSAYWHLDEAPGATLLRDSSGNENNASTVNAPSLGNTPASSLMGGSSVLFSNTQHALVSDSPTVSPTGAFSIEAWVRPTTSASERYIMEKYDAASNNGFALRLVGMTPRAHILYASAFSTLDSTVSLVADTWSHVVITYDLTTLRIYVNGTPAGSLATANPPTDGTYSLKIAARGNDALAPGIGTLDELALYSNALSAARVQAHYDASTSLVAGLSGKALWLRASDLGAGGTSVATWPDQSGSAKNGTASGTAPTVADTSTPMGGKSVRFAGSGHFTFGSVLNAGSPGEMWMVVKSDGGMGPSSWKFGTHASQNHYTYTGAVYEDFGSGARRSFTPTVPVTSWRIYRVRNDGTLWEASIDGVTQLSVASAPLAWTSSVQIGASLTGSGFQGNIAEVLVRSQISTPQEASDLMNYFVRTHFSAATGGIVHGEYIEAISSPTYIPRALHGAYIETLATPALTPRRVHAVYMEALSIPTETPRRILGSYLEALTDRQTVTTYTGWGSQL